MLVEGITNDTFAAVLSIAETFSQAQQDSDCPLSIDLAMDILDTIHAHSLRKTPEEILQFLDEDGANVSVNIDFSSEYVCIWD